MIHQPQQPTEYAGKVERMVFTAPDGAFRVFEMMDKGGKRHRVSQRGPFAEIKPNDMILVVGKPGKHERFGEQIYAKDVLPQLPETGEGMAKVLSGGAFKGIGAKTAQKLIKLFDTRLIEILEQNDPNGEISTAIGAKKAAAIISAWNENLSLNHAHVTLASLDIGPAIRKKIFETYPDYNRILTGDPYRLYRDIEGIGFSTADRLATRMSLPKDCPKRLSAGISHALDLARDDGHTGLYRNALIEKAAEALEFNDRAKLGEIIDDEVRRRTIKIADNGLYQRKDVALIEERIASFVVRQSTTPLTSIDNDHLLDILERTQIEFGLTDSQTIAVERALNNPLSILTGGPGTGKTKTIQAVIYATKQLLGEDSRVLQMAPTGKAADRMQQATGHPAGTIHRMLGYQPMDGGFLHNHENPLEADMIILDEASMPDIRIFDSFIRACGHARVLMVGDVDQLPSVDMGRVLLDVIDSEICPVTRLTEIFRQAAGSEISLGAASINSGKYPSFGAPGKSALVFIEANTPEEGAERLISAVGQNLPKFLDVEASTIQVLTPGKNSDVGSISLNSALQDQINPGPDLAFGKNRSAVVRLRDGHHARSGDKVICTENDYANEVYNGDIGTIEGLVEDEDNVVLTVNFAAKTVAYGPDAWGRLGLAYALTIHKSQGSEYDVVVMPITTSHYRMLKRNLLYTGITRAKRLCVIIGTKRALSIAINTLDGINRNTTLLPRIQRLSES